MIISKTTKINILLSVIFLFFSELKIFSLYFFTKIIPESPHSISSFLITCILGFLLNLIYFALSNTIVVYITKNKLNTFTYKLISFLIYLFIFSIIEKNNPYSYYLPNYIMLITNVINAIILSLIYSNNKNYKPLFYSTLYTSITLIFSSILSVYIISFV